MRFATDLIPARLIRRYKRFLADAVPEAGPDAGREVTVHCPNPGAMLGLAAPGARIWLEPVASPPRKLPYAWRLEETDGGCVAIDTGLANRVAAEALAAGAVPGLDGYDRIRPEVRYGAGSRVDFLVSGAGRPDAYVEVKSVTLHRGGALAEFPDSVTARGAKHLGELVTMAAAGHRGVLLYLVMRGDCDRVGVAADLDPRYAAAVLAARAAGVEVLALSTRPGTAGVAAGGALAVI